MNTTHHRWLIALSVAATLTTAARTQTPAAENEKLPPGAKLVRIEAAPARIALKGPFDYAQLLLTGVLAGGERMDVTRLARLEVPARDVIKATGAAGMAWSGRWPTAWDRFASPSTARR